jgi:hypothetical protein
MATEQNRQKTVKAFDKDIALINLRAHGLGCSAADVIHTLCEALRKEIYLQELSESFDSILNNPEQVAAFQSEQKMWDCALSDGLDDAP